MNIKCMKESQLLLHGKQVQGDAKNSLHSWDRVVTVHTSLLLFIRVSWNENVCEGLIGVGQRTEAYVNVSFV